MAIFSFTKFSSGIKDYFSAKPIAKKEVLAHIPSNFYGPVISYVFDGEKNLGEIGPARAYKIDFATLRARSWQARLDSEIAKTVIEKFALWVVGSGLKLQSEPLKLILESEGYPSDANSIQKFSNMVESLFHLYSSSKCADYAGMNTLNQIEKIAFINAIISGDVLVILRYVKGEVKVQLIDGANVVSPNFGSSQALPNGNRIVNGIEISPEGRHIAYYVRKPNNLLATERVEAIGKKTGKVMAYMVYGDRYRLNDQRGIPIIVTVLETLSKLERYKEATVGAAEEAAKIVYQVVHKEYSTGENPMLNQATKALNVDNNLKPGQNPIDVSGKELADNVAATTNKMTYNLPIGSELKSLTSEKELYFKDFYQTLAKVVCATVGIPYGVAFSDYDGSYSASRAEIMDWKHICTSNREYFSSQFVSPIYVLWLDTKVLENKIQAPGYDPMNNESIINQAYQCARWTGPNVPHIDPLKEVKAVREKLGTAGRHLPLTTMEAAIEELGGGDSDEVMSQFAEELKEAEALGIEDENSKNEEPNETETPEKDS